MASSFVASVNTRFNHVPLPNGTSNASTFHMAVGYHGARSTNLRCFG